MEAKLPSNNQAYILGDKIYPRITSVMKTIPKPWLDKWRSDKGEDEANRIADETAGIGDKIHKVTELWDWRETRAGELYQLIEDEPWLIPYMWAWREYVEKYVERIVWVEQVVFSERLGVAGRLDRLLVFKGDMNTSIGDIKSTKALHDDMGVQLAFYRMAVEEEVERMGLDEWMVPKRTVILHLPGPRENDEESGRVFDKVKVKEYDWRRYTDKLEDCVDTYYALNT